MKPFALMIVGALLLAVPVACTSDGKADDCRNSTCSGDSFGLKLVDDNGDPVLTARGLIAEVNTRRNFNCDGEPDPSEEPTDCKKGVVTLLAPTGPISEYHIRFERADGTLTPFQDVDVTLDKQTHDDAIGEGCTCDYYEGSAAPLVVPADARDPDVGGIGGAGP